MTVMLAGIELGVKSTVKFDNILSELYVAMGLLHSKVWQKAGYISAWLKLQLNPVK